jgi:hypothetical protein
VPHPLIALIVGTLAGTHVATWGMYKDAPHEGFTYRKYARSIVIGALLGLALERVAGLDLASGAGLVVFFGLVYAAERVVVEIWKTFFREEDQSKYFIPMQFSLYGRRAVSAPVRRVVGTLCLGVVGLVAYALVRLQDANPAAPRWVMVLAVGSLFGWLAAVGGAWKDAPKEGFEPLKFFRSPLTTLAWALLLAQFTDRYAYIAFGALGYERAAVETYTTFFFPHKPRGKFAGKPVHFPEMLRRRVRFADLDAGIWAAVAAAYAAAFAAPSGGAPRSAAAAADRG